MIVRNTQQKREILQAVTTLHTHPTAEEVFDYLKSQGSKTSKATVYRVLRQLSDQGIIRRVLLPDQSDRYDFNMNPHQHALCKSCGKIVDIFCSDFPDLLQFAEPAHDFELTSYDVVYEGYCSECQQNRRLH